MAFENDIMIPETGSSSPWEERFGWYHYDGRAVFGYGEDELERAAKRYAENGVTAVILFGAHFRFSFLAYWDAIEAFIARFTRAFHKYGIKVIEHHSTHLTYDPVDPETFWAENLAPGKPLSTYPDFRKNCETMRTPEGVHPDAFAQIDGSTGKPCLSSYIHTEGRDVHWIFKHYNGRAHCFNHPAFEKAYWGHVRRIIEKAGIDGIMNDDVQWFGGGNACACPYCRAKFKAETGYELPDPEHWSSFFEHYERPDYVAWKAFKKKQSGDFHFRMEERYRERRVPSPPPRLLRRGPSLRHYLLRLRAGAEAVGFYLPGVLRHCEGLLRLLRGGGGPPVRHGKAEREALHGPPVPDDGRIGLRRLGPLPLLGADVHRHRRKPGFLLRQTDAGIRKTARYVLPGPGQEGRLRVLVLSGDPGLFRTGRAPKVRQ
ncbi:MAG: hypothetical protein ILO68_06940 [Clostridia bacterium]|nr:hypothetical protein [Clostridia bacterium]